MNDWKEALEELATRVRELEALELRAKELLEDSR